MWKKALAVLFGFLILGLTVSSATAMASSANSTVNSTITVPPEFNPEKKPGDEVRPQFWWIGLIILDAAASWFLEHYVSPEVAAVYDAVTILIDPAKIAEKLGIKGAKLGIKIISRNKVLIGLFKDNKVVKEITYASKEAAEWVSNKLGKDYIGKIVEKYVVKDGGLRKGEDFDEVAKALKRIYELGITNGDARRFIVDKGWDVKKLEKVLEDVESVRGGDELIKKINADFRDEKTLGPLYEAEVVSYLKHEGWIIKEVEHDFKLHGETGDIDIIAQKGSERVYIECKRKSSKISEEQLLKEAEYANMNGVEKLVVYYSRDTASMGQWYRIREAVREAKAKYGVNIELKYHGSEFN
ncbi:MAG: hypothetical protein PWP39_885 [Pyrococcus sp.]|uniref:restriction endonuclease n=1 Tax=Pyrococcus sp. TaxID=33866 RepID=UPI00258FB354|nr:restriction endonuclease [Pyrococcus sp.]MDK2869650.1 hypothetical protein [Pyrococcus sp.]